MRHGDKINNLSRTTSHRKAMLANMACSLIQYRRIKTTVAKAKVLRQYVEPIITKAKDNNMAAFRYAFLKLRYKEAVKILFKDVMPVIGERPGGYTRILKIGKRHSDSTPMCYIELVDFNTTYKTKEDTKKKRTRRGKTTKKSTEQNTENKEQKNTNTEE